MTGWQLIYDGFDPAAEGQREALCTLGNGFFATRGAAPEGSVTLGDLLVFNPRLPDPLRRLRLRLRYRGHSLRVELSRGTFRLMALPSSEPPVRVAVRDQEYSCPAASA